MFRQDRLRVMFRRAGLLAAAGLCLFVLTACIGGDDNDEPETVVEVTAPPSDPTTEPEATATDEVEPTATEEPSATSTPEPSPTATLTPTPALPTATPTNTPTPTPTPLPTVENPAKDAQPVDRVTANFSLTYSVQFTGSEHDTDIRLEVSQHNADSYHIRVENSGQHTEAWRVGDVTWVAGPNGAIVELPGLVDPNLYAPSSFLFLIPDLRQLGSATVLDENAEVEGRPATHYEVDPAAGNFFWPQQSEPPGEPEGTFELWIDHELNLIVRAEADVKWGTAANAPRMVMSYLISQLNSTPEVQPPAQ